MNLKLVRTNFTDKSTTGVLFVNGMHECFILEDVCREATPGTWSKDLKVYGKTAIPYGRYRIILDFSQRFQRLMPLLLAIPDFEGIRIHPGNTAENTEGCLLTGITRDDDLVGNSQAAYGALFRKLQVANENDKIWIEITKA